MVTAADAVFSVTLNLFQGPSPLAHIRFVEARWMLKQVQHDGAEEAESW